jgi:hypothetical protein
MIGKMVCITKVTTAATEKNPFLMKPTVDSEVDALISLNNAAYKEEEVVAGYEGTQLINICLQLIIERKNRRGCLMTMVSFSVTMSESGSTCLF